MQNKQDCRCGNTYGKHDKYSYSECDNTCRLYGTGPCGGVWRQAIFRTKDCNQGRTHSITSFNNVLSNINLFPWKNANLGKKHNGSFTLTGQTQIQTRIQIPNPMATLYYAEYVHIAQTQTRIPTPYFCLEQESKSESISSINCIKKSKCIEVYEGLAKLVNCNQILGRVADQDYVEFIGYLSLSPTM